jgi:hypothetical protein
MWMLQRRKKTYALNNINYCKYSLNFILADTSNTLHIICLLFGILNLCDSTNHYISKALFPQERKIKSKQLMAWSNTQLGHKNITHML